MRCAREPAPRFQEARRRSATRSRVPHRDETETSASIVDLLDDTLRTDPALLPRIGREIAGGRAVVLPNAFRADLAERIREALDGSHAWSVRLHAAPERPYFQYRHFGIYELPRMPADVRALERVLSSRATRSRLRELTGSDCDGPFDFGAAAYHAGDYSSPHNDCNGRRSLSYIWYLAKDWKPEWGGQFIWCPTGAMVNPGFNTLIMFKITERSLHFVTPLTHLARDRRLSITGFWQRSVPDRAKPPPRCTLAGLELCAGQYGEPTETVDRLVLL